jgi:hypothetical protein
VFARQEVGPLICVKCDSIGKKKKEKVTRPWRFGVSYGWKSQEWYSDVIV